MFTRYAEIGVGHDAVHSRRHAHESIDDQLATSDDEADVNKMEDPPLNQVSQNNKDITEEGRGEKDEDEDRDEDRDEGSEGDEDGNSDSSVASDFEESF